jgi:SAM-dependent methyltransferase
MAVRTAEREAAFFLPLLTPGMKLLDAGCGPGTITVGLAQHVAPGEVTGFDIGESEVERATKLAAEKNLLNVSFQVADSTGLPFEDEEFDAVFSSAMLEHVPQREKALDEMIRVLKPDGVIGLRGGNHPGSLVGPKDDTLLKLEEVYIAIWMSRGGAPDFGIRQMPLLLERGMLDVHQTASYETRDPHDPDFAIRIKTDAFVDAAESLGVSTRDELYELSDRLIARSGNPLNYTHISWIEVTARKPA